MNAVANTRSTRPFVWLLRREFWENRGGFLWAPLIAGASVVGVAIGFGSQTLVKDVVTGLVLLLTAPLIPLFMALIGALTDALSARQWASLSRMSAHFLDVLQGLTTLKLFNRSREQIESRRPASRWSRSATTATT